MKFPIFSDRGIEFSEVTNSPFIRARYSSPNSNMKIIAPCKGYIYMVYHPNIINEQLVNGQPPRTWCLVFKPDSSEGIHRIPEWAIPEFNEILFFVEEFSSDSREPYSNAYIAQQALGLYRDRMAVNGSTEAITIPIYERNTAGTLHRSTRSAITLAQDGSNLVEVASNFATTYWNNSRILYLPVEAGQVIADFTNNFTSKKIEVAVWWMDDTRRPLRDGQCYIFDTHRYFQILRATEHLSFTRGFTILHSPLGNQTREGILTSLNERFFSIKCRRLNDGTPNNRIKIKNFGEKIEIDLPLEIQNQSLSESVRNPKIPYSIFRFNTSHQNNFTNSLEITTHRSYDWHEYNTIGVVIHRQSDFNISSIDWASLERTISQNDTDISFLITQPHNEGQPPVNSYRIRIGIIRDYVGRAMDIVYEIYSIINRFEGFKQERSEVYPNLSRGELLVFFEQLKSLLLSGNAGIASQISTNIDSSTNGLWRYYERNVYEAPLGFKHRLSVLFVRLGVVLNSQEYYDQLMSELTQYNLEIHYWAVKVCFDIQGDGENSLMDSITSSFFTDTVTVRSTTINYFNTILKRTHGNLSETIVKTIALILTHDTKKNLLTRAQSAISFDAKLEELVGRYNRYIQSYNSRNLDNQFPFQFRVQGDSSLPIQERIRTNIKVVPHPDLPANTPNRAELLAAFDTSLKSLKTFVNFIDFAVKARDFSNNPNLENYTFVVHAGASLWLKYRENFGAINSQMRSTGGIRVLHTLEIVGATFDIYKSYKAFRRNEGIGENLEAFFSITSMFGSGLIVVGEISSLVGAIEFGLPLILVGKAVVFVGDIAQIVIPNPSEFEIFVRQCVFGIIPDNAPANIIGNIGIQRAFLNKFLYPLRVLGLSPSSNDPRPYVEYFGGSALIERSAFGHPSGDLIAFILPVRFTEFTLAIKEYGDNSHFLESYLLPIEFSENHISIYFRGYLSPFIPNVHQHSANNKAIINLSISSSGVNALYISFSSNVTSREIVMTLGQIPPNRLANLTEEQKVAEIFEHYPFTTRNF